MKNKKEIKVKGWKVFDKNLQCRKFQFEVGKEYTQKGILLMCTNGFHFHESPSDLFNYYTFDSNNRVCEIEAYGEYIKGDDKSVCSTIFIVKELSWYKVLDLINIGKGNTGRNNSGNYNSGDYNSGDYNSGYYNSGDYNSGDYNSTNFSSGMFNSVEQKVPLFNGAVWVLMSEFKNTKNYSALFSSFLNLTEWVSTNKMNEKEKENHPEFKTVGGYLKTRTYFEACEEWWKNMSEENKQLVKEIPGFNKKIFKEITGIST